MEWRSLPGTQCCGVHVTPPQLRHTHSTQLLNADCTNASIQKLLGHQRLNSTMTYARVHDKTVAEDYYRAMQSVERLPDLDAVPAMGQPAPACDKTHVATVIARLAEMELTTAARLALVDELCSALGIPLIRSSRSAGCNTQSEARSYAVT